MNWLVLLLSGLIGAVLFYVSDLIHRYFDSRASLKSWHKDEDIDMVCSGCPYKDDCISGYEPCRVPFHDNKS